MEMERCVLMDNVTVEDGAILSNSLLCQNSTIGFKAEIIHSCIGLDVSVAPEASIANGVV